MTKILSVCLFSLIIITAIFCVRPEKKQKGVPVVNSAISQQHDPKIDLREVGFLEFDRSFSFLQSSALSKKEIDKLFKETENSNPLLIPHVNNDSVRQKKEDSIRDKLEQFGIVNEKDFLFTKFNGQSRNKIQLVNEHGKTVDVQFHQGLNSVWTVKLSAELDTVNIQLDDHPMELRYRLLDVVPGGYKEIVILDEEYVSNNNLYFLVVYEVKNSH